MARLAEKRPKFRVRLGRTFASRTNKIKCTRKFTEAIPSRLSCIPVKYQPESDDLADRLEDIYKLVLCAHFCQLEFDDLSISIHTHLSHVIGHIAHCNMAVKLHRIRVERVYTHQRPLCSWL